MIVWQDLGYQDSAFFARDLEHALKDLTADAPALKTPRHALSHQKLAQFIELQCPVADNLRFFVQRDKYAVVAGFSRFSVGAEVPTQLFGD